MQRSEIREEIFKLLFRVEFFDTSEMAAQEELFVEERSESLTDKDADHIRKKFERILEHLPEIDDLISTNTEGWEVKRMAKTDLAVIRLAVYEIRFDDSIPTGVAINEAVELAKKYGQESAPSFVNGVLAKFA